MRTPYPYQIPGIEYLRKTKQAALFWQMRLGKSLVIIQALCDEDAVLIVCPKPVIPVWKEELRLEGITDVYSVTSKEAKFLTDALPQFLIANYEAIPRIPEKIRALFDVVVLDESVRIKDPRTKITKFFLRNFTSPGLKKIIASGNPAPNDVMEYFPQMQFLHGRWMGCENFWKFRHRFFSSDMNGWRWFPRKGVRERIKRQLNEDAFVLSRKKVGVENKKVYEKRFVEMPSSIRKMYRQMEDEFVTTLPSGKKVETKYIVAQISYLMQLAGGHISRKWVLRTPGGICKKRHTRNELSLFKILEIKNLVSGELKGEPLVIWCNYTWEIEQIKNHLSGVLRIKSIEGKTSIEDRQIIQKEFQDGVLDALVMQTATGKYGLNLSRSSTMIYYSNGFRVDDRVQSEQRIEHNEKKEPLLYIDLLTKGTVEEDIYAALQRKRKMVRFFLDDVMASIITRRKNHE